MKSKFALIKFDLCGYWSDLGAVVTEPIEYEQYELLSTNI